MRKEPTLIEQDQSSLILLYERLAPVLLAYFSRRTASRNDAEDLLVEVFLAALENERLRDLSASEQERWLWKVARNKEADHFRLLKRLGSVPLDVEVIETVLENPALTPEESLIRQEAYADLHTALRTLSPRQRMILELRFGYELSCGQIATVLKKTEGSIRMLLVRTLKQLRALYQQHAR